MGFPNNFYRCKQIKFVTRCFAWGPHAKFPQKLGGSERPSRPLKLNRCKNVAAGVSHAIQISMWGGIIFQMRWFSCKMWDIAAFSCSRKTSKTWDSLILRSHNHFVFVPVFNIEPTLIFSRVSLCQFLAGRCGIGIKIDGWMDGWIDR